MARPLERWEELARGTPFRVMFVAEAAGTLVAMAGFEREEAEKFRHSGRVFAVYTRPAWRGARLTDALFRAGEEWACGEDVRILKLSVVASNVAAIRCYLRCGYNVYGVEPEAIRNGDAFEDELLMAKRLT